MAEQLFFMALDFTGVSNKIANECRWFHKISSHRKQGTVDIIYAHI